MVDRNALIPASYLYLIDAGRVLLQLRQNTGYMDGTWAAGAAGHIEIGETAAQAASREAGEELGIGVDERDLQCSSIMQRTDGSENPVEQRVDWFFICRSWRGTPKVQETTKVAALQWFLLDDLPLRISDYERQALQWVRQGRGVGCLSFGFDRDDTALARPA